MSNTTYEEGPGACSGYYATRSDWRARRSDSHRKIKPAAEVEGKVRRRKADVVAAAEPGISNGRVEAIDNKVKVTVETGHGFCDTDSPIALTMPRCSDMRPELPGRPPKPGKKSKQAGKKAA